MTNHSKLVVKSNKPRNQKQTLGRLVSYLGKSKLLITLAIILSVVATLGGLYASYAISPMIDTIQTALDGTVSYDVMMLTLWKQILFLAIVFIVEVAGMYLSGRLMVKISQRTVQSIRKEMFEKILKTNVVNHDQNAHGDLMSRFTNDIDLVGEGLNSAAASIIINIFTLFGTVAVMFYLNAMLTLITLIIIPLLGLMSTAIVKKSKIYSKRQQQSLGDLNGYIEESIEGQSVMQLFNHEAKSQSIFNKKNTIYRKNAQWAQITSIMIYPLMQNINTISYAVIGIVGGYLSVQGRLSVSNLIAYVNMTRQQGKPINEISSQFTILQSALASAERIFELIDWKEEPSKPNDLLVDDIKGDVRFENVNFGYTPQKMVLKDVTFWASQGEKIAFVGSTGAGKTTITNLISRFYEINSGSILIDGINLQDINRWSLRKNISMVLQDTNLFTGTIMENIRYGNLEATDEECIAAAKLANAHHFIKTLEKGYNTIISGTGSELSQGQKQLLNIARAAVANPKILILDEATSSIDTRTEKLIEKGMDSLMNGRTTFIIAHRLSTVRNADAIIVLENGQIIERGSHDVLVAQNGRYASLYSGQTELT